jgi:hypothetical protein
VDARVSGAPPPVGSAAEEAARLFAAAEQWLRERTAGPVGASHASGPGGGAECAVCPLCQGIAAVRSIRPETVEHLLDATASFVAALRSTVAAGGPEASATARRPDVQRIPVSDSDLQGDQGRGD